MIMTVTQFVTYLNETFKAIWDTTEAAVEGEVSGFRVSQGQWVNFDIKDDESLVSCFCVLAKMPFRLEDGMRVRVYGMPRVYQKYGKFSFSVERFDVLGEGALKKALAALRARLEKEGLFDPARKRELPRFPQKIALVASTESAAYGDFLRIVSERWGGLEIDSYHVVVQGEKAPASICRALAYIATKREDYDVVVMTRGGGSFEELMAFQDERVVRAIYACPVPTLVAIGHERDVTLAEEVADVRGSTPTDCARRLVPDRRDLSYEVSVMGDRIDAAIDRQLETLRHATTSIFASTDRWLARSRQALQTRQYAVDQAADRWLAALQQRVGAWAALTAAVDPKRVLARGYVLVKDRATGAFISRAHALRSQQLVELCLQDGTVPATIGENTNQQLSIFSYGQEKA